MIIITFLHTTHLMPFSVTFYTSHHIESFFFLGGSEQVDYWSSLKASPLNTHYIYIRASQFGWNISDQLCVFSTGSWCFHAEHMKRKKKNLLGNLFQCWWMTRGIWPLVSSHICTQVNQEVVLYSSKAQLEEVQFKQETCSSYIAALIISKGANNCGAYFCWKYLSPDEGFVFLLIKFISIIGSFHQKVKFCLSLFTHLYKGCR